MSRAFGNFLSCADGKRVFAARKVERAFCFLHVRAPEYQSSRALCELTTARGADKGTRGSPLVNLPHQRVATLWTPGDSVRRPPMKITADSLALRSSGLDVLIHMGTIPYVSRTEITFFHIVRVPYVEF